MCPGPTIFLTISLASCSSFYCWFLCLRQAGLVYSYILGGGGVVQSFLLLLFSCGCDCVVAVAVVVIFDDNVVAVLRA